MTGSPPASRRPRPRAMLLSMALVWGLGTVAATVVVDANVACRIPYLADLAADYAQRADSSIVAIGTSRFRDGLEINRLTAYLRRSLPERPMSAFIAVVTSSAHVTQEVVLRELLDAGRKPAAVVLEMNPEFVDARKKWIEVTRDMTWSTLFDLNGNEIKSLGSKVAANRLLPLYVRRFEIRRALWRWAYQRWGATPPKLDRLEPTVPTLLTTFEPSPQAPPPYTDAVRDLQVRMVSPPMTTFEPTGSSARALERVLTTCQARGIPALMVYAPICSRSRGSLAAVEEPFNQYVAALLARYPLARYYDASSLLPDNAFVDHYHPNNYGLDLLCRRLAQVVLPDAFSSWDRERGGGPSMPVASAPDKSTIKTH